jgi:hypothetical protein
MHMDLMGLPPLIRVAEPMGLEILGHDAEGFEP